MVLSSAKQGHTSISDYFLAFNRRTSDTGPLVDRILTGDMDTFPITGKHHAMVSLLNRLPPRHPPPERRGPVTAPVFKGVSHPVRISE